jgi:putative transposase
LIPIFDSKLKSLKKDRKISKVTVRMMNSFRHYDFRMRLKEVAERFAWCHVIETREPYTSKTCGNCGHLNDKLGSNKIFNCPSCAYCADRDANGARNILLRYLTIMGTNQDDE